MQTQTKNVFGANIQEASSSSKGKVSILDSRGLEVGEVECRDKEPCLSRGGEGTALAVQLRGDQVHCVHNSYYLPSLPSAVLYFFQACVLFYTKKAKCLPFGLI